MARKARNAEVVETPAEVVETTVDSGAIDVQDAPTTTTDSQGEAASKPEKPVRVFDSEDDAKTAMNAANDAAKAEDKKPTNKVYAVKATRDVSAGEQVFVVSKSPGFAAVDGGNALGILAERMDYQSVPDPETYLNLLSPEQLEECERLIKELRSVA